MQRLDPSLPHTWFNLGIYYKKAGQLDKALVVEQMVKLVPNEPIAHYQLGSLLRSAGRNAEAIEECEKAAVLNPQLAGPHFQLYNLYRQSARPEEAAKNLAIFQALKKQAEGAPIPEGVDRVTTVKFNPPRVSTAIPAEAKPRYDDRALAPAIGMITIDPSSSGHTDLLAWSANAIHLYRNGTDLVKDSGLENISGVISVAAGDFDNDGFMDLCILTENGPKLYRNTKGHFARFEAALPNVAERAIWIDYDHDYDLDLLLIGAQPALLRNQGKAGFEERTKDFRHNRARDRRVQTACRADTKSV